MQIKTPDEHKLSLLMDAPGVNKDDILSHTWELFAQDDEELWLKCKVCEYYYSVTVFKNGSIVKWFVSSLLDRENSPIINCNACQMESAIG